MSGVPWHAGSSPEHSTSRSVSGADGRNRPPALAITTVDVDSCRSVRSPSAQLVQPGSPHLAELTKSCRRSGSRPQSAAGSCMENRPVSSRKWHEVSPANCKCCAA